jgi:hypothetical protein
MVLYWLAHGISPKKMNALNGVSASTIRKYTYIVCDALFNGDKLFSVYVRTPTKDQLFHIIKWFCDITSPQQICGVIDGTHIPLSAKPNLTNHIFYCKFYNRKHSHNIMFQDVCDCDMFSWNACTGQPSGVVDERQFKMSSLYCSLWSRQILQKLVVTIEGV